MGGTEEAAVRLRNLPSIVTIMKQSKSQCWESVTQADGHLCFPATYGTESLGEGDLFIHTFKANSHLTLTF